MIALVLAGGGFSGKALGVGIVWLGWSLWPVVSPRGMLHALHGFSRSNHRHFGSDEIGQGTAEGLEWEPSGTACTAARVIGAFFAAFGVYLVVHAIGGAG